MVGATRIELATSRPPDVRATTALSPEKTRGKLLLRKTFPLCVVQIEKINFLYFSSLSGLGDQIWTGDLAVPNRARYQLRHAQIFLSYHDSSHLVCF